MKTRRYAVILEPGEDGWIVAHVPAFPGCWTQGETRDDALANAREALELIIEVMLENGEALPEEPQEVDILEVAI